MESERIATRTKRTLRLTGRGRIKRDRIRLKLILGEDGRAKAFEGTLDLRDLGLPAEAQVVVMAGRGDDVERFEVGTVGDGSISVRQDLGEIGVYGSGLRFRVLVVDPRTRRILTSAERLQFHTLRERGILPVVPRDLGKLAWQIEFEEEGPLLVLNKRLPTGAFRSPQFVCYALPAVLREILGRALRERAQEGEWEEEEDEPEDWKSRWFAFAEKLTDRKAPEGDPDEREVQEWLDQAILAFCERKTGQDWRRLLGEYQP